MEGKSYFVDMVINDFVITLEAVSDKNYQVKFTFHFLGAKNDDKFKKNSIL